MHPSRATLTVPASRINITMGYSRFFSQPDALFLLSGRKTTASGSVCSMRLNWGVNSQCNKNHLHLYTIGEVLQGTASNFHHQSIFKLLCWTGTGSDRTFTFTDSKTRPINRARSHPPSLVCFRHFVVAHARATPLTARGAAVVFRTSAVPPR